MDLCKCGFVLLFLLHFIESKECVIDTRPPIASWEHQLLKDLRQCGNISEPPDLNNTQVVLKFILKSFYFDAKEEELSINIWLMFFWNDSRLSWNPEDYDNITEVPISTVYIWTPNLILHDYYLRLYSSNKLNTIDSDYFYKPYCRVNNSGKVSCIPRVLYQTTCNTKLSDWPYDIQNCSFRFGVSSKRDRTTFALKSSRIILFGAEYGPGWNIIDYTVNEQSNSIVQFSLNLVLERQGIGLAASVVVPPLVLSAITFISLFLEVDGGNRLSLLCFSLLNQFFFLQVINNEIPTNGADSPTILFYLRSLIILTLLSIGVTFLLRYFKRRSDSPSYIIKVSMDKIFNTYGKYLIWPRWSVNIGNHGVMNDKIENASLWAYFASVTNFVFMVLIAVIFITHFFAYIPQQQTYNS